MGLKPGRLGRTSSRGGHESLPKQEQNRMWYRQVSNEIALHFDDEVSQMDPSRTTEKADWLFERTKDCLNNTDNLQVFAQNPSDSLTYYWPTYPH